MTDTRARAAQLTDTLPAGTVSDELAPVIDRLGLADNCRQLVDEGYTVIAGAAAPEVTARLREAILTASRITSDADAGGASMLLRRDPVFAEVVLNPKLMAMAEFSVGRGHLLSQVAGSVKPRGGAGLALHADQNWFPAPFPEHNYMVTFCWTCDEYTREGGATLMIPGTHRLRRHPDHDEIAAADGAIAIECPAGSVAVWDGSVWHGAWPRTTEGQRVVCHITYCRLAARQVEDYGPWADELIGRHGEAMAQLLGRTDSLFKPTGFDYSRLVSTFNTAKR
ncbi:MAG TPA: phytanoyl-CoA dioxygenase family protein [Acidimicrobiales bacterium]|nr:phytanoyl-CoA dioxygenase family protein [Acidimicrobiales bacterium]